MSDEIALISKPRLRDGNRSARPEVLRPEVLRTQARMSYFSYFVDDDMRRRRDGTARIDYVKLIVLIAAVAVPWEALVWLARLLVQRL